VIKTCSFPIFYMKKVRMNYTQIASNFGMIIRCYAGLEYELSDKEADDFVKCGAAMFINNVVVHNKMRGRPRKVKTDERIIETRDRTGNRSRSSRGRKNLSKN